MSKPTEENTAHAACEANLERLLGTPNVTGVGVGYRMRNGRQTKEICVHVFVDRKLASGDIADAAAVPSSVSGPGGEIATDVIELYNVSAQQDTTRYRPVPGGCSIGPEGSFSAGTLGGYACDETDDTIVLLSNNHVISNLDTMPALRRIVQPGRLDGGVLPADVIGQLKRHVQVNTIPNPPGGVPPVSVVDAAIGTLEEVQRTDNIQQLDVPAIYEIETPVLGARVQKRGRTTRLTTNGTVFSVGVTQNLNYSGGTRLGRIQNSFIIRSTDGNQFSAPGDSGSLILNQVAGEVEGTFPVMGLLYGGGTFNDGTPATIANDINAVFGALNLSTVCNCVARALIRAVFSSERIDDGANEALVRRKEKQMRSFRANLLSEARFGKIANGLITREAARVGKILNEDDEAFGLLAKALHSWVMLPTNHDVLESKFDDESIEYLKKFAARVARKNRKLAPQFKAIEFLLEAIRGRSVDQVLRSAKLRLDPEKPPRKPPKKKK